MASTADGRLLTAAHQRTQIAIGARAAEEALLLWPLLDWRDLDGSSPYWTALSTLAVNRRMQQSQAAAATYLDEYRQAEIGKPATVALGAPAGTATALRIAGLVRVKKLIARGMDPEDAHSAAFTKYAGIVRRQTMMGGRLTIARTTGRDRRAIGWRRVTDGNPCAFCAMLASRGPVYRDAASADGLQYHAHCGCSAEPEYSAWEPTETEQGYIDAYTDARYPARTKSVKAVLRDMRRNGNFRDSPKTPPTDR